MRIVCLGGGPAGLYFSILMKRADPAHEITLYERNKPDDTFGWGVVFSDATLGNFAEADSESYADIVLSFHHWNACEIHFKGRQITSGGHGFSGIGRRKLLNILQARATALGVKQVFEADLTDDAEFAGADLIVAADGINSMLRNKYAEHFKPDIDVRKCRYIWFGSRLKLNAFTFITEPTEWGWFQAHAFQFDPDTSTFIVECREETWLAAGLDKLDPAGSIAFCEKLFAKYLAGNALLINAQHKRGSAWLNFSRVQCQKWHYKNIVLLGDAAHTAHFSIGSGTKLAMEDAIALTRVLGANPGSIEQALELYQEERSLEVLKIQSAARNRMEWFENVGRYAHLMPEQFAYSLLTGSQRIGHENLRLRDSHYVDGIEGWLAAQCGIAKQAGQQLPPMFTPFKIAGLTLKNRIVVSPMAMYSCQGGMPDDFLLVHLGSRALGGAGLVMTEMTAVAPEARITPGCAGIWNIPQMMAWQRIVNFVHKHSDTKIGLQLGHSGPKGSTQLGWERIDEPLASGNWPLLAASAIPYGPHNQTPRAMTRDDMDEVLDEFIVATRRAAVAGFDLLELHCAHGYLLSSFICPLTNRRDDDYGGSLENRLRFPLEICRVMRDEWPRERPLSVRISAHDWVPGGNTPDDAVIMARMFREAGADLIDVSSGLTTREAKPVYGRMYQTPFADRIRNEVGIATMAVGNIFEADHVNTIIAAGRADLCALARPHLADPAWTLHAAAQQDYREISWPQQYLNGKEQLERILARGTPLVLNV